MKNRIFILLMFMLAAAIFSPTNGTATPHLLANDPLLFGDGFEEDPIPFQSPEFPWKPIQMGIEADVVTDPVRAGNYALRLSLDYDGPWTAPSAEWRLIKPESVQHFDIGNSYWYGFSVYLPDNFSPNNATEIVTQFMGAPDVDLGETWNRNPPISLKLNGREWQLLLRSDADVDSSDKIYDQTLAWGLEDWQDGEWTDWVFQIHWAYEEDGILRVWKNGVKLVDYIGPNTFNDVKGPYWRLGINEWAWLHHPTDVLSRTLYFDEIRIADHTGTYADVAPGNGTKPPPTEETHIAIKAAGRSGDEEMALLIDEAVVATFENVGGNYFHGAFETFTVTHKTAVSPDQIRVQFQNDSWIRDLRVDNIAVDGVVIESETAYGTGVWTAADGCTSGYYQTEYLNCNGYFEYGTPTVPPPITQDAIYVSPAGDDSNPGTETQPLRTIQTAVNLAQPGDTVYLREGTYVEFVEIRNSGTADSPITISAFPGETPIINGMYTLPWGEPATCNDKTAPPTCFVYTPLLRIAGSYIHINGIEVTESRGRGIVVDNNFEERPHHVTIENCHVHHIRSTAILVYYADHVTVKGCDIHHAANFATHSRPSGELNWPVIVNSIGANDVTFADNIIHESWGEGIAAGRDSTNIHIVDNIIYDNYALQVYVHRSQDTLVERNLIYNTGQEHFLRGRNPSQCLAINNEPYFENATTVKNAVVVNNIIAGCRHNISIWGSSGSGLPIENVYIAHNTLINAITYVNEEAKGLHIHPKGNFTNIQIENNIILQETDLIADIPNNPQISFGHNVWSRVPPSAAAGSGDIVGDPKLKNALSTLSPGNVKADWFTPLASSPAIDSGSGNMSTDYWSRARIGNPDIGAIEYSP